MSHFLIIEARFYTDLADELALGASEALEAAGFGVTRIDVPGAFEIPGVIAMAAQSKKERYRGYVALGVVIRGQTSHYDYVCGESARGLQDLAIQHRLAIGYGILTVEDRDQAWVRADRSRGNKGRDAAEAAIKMAELRDRFGVASS